MKKNYKAVMFFAGVVACQAAEESLSPRAISAPIAVPESPNKAGYNSNPFTVGSEKEERSLDLSRDPSLPASFKQQPTVGSPFEQPLMVPSYNLQKREDKAVMSRQESRDASTEQDKEVDQLVAQLVTSPKALEAVTVFLLKTSAFQKRIDAIVEERIKKDAFDSSSSGEEFEGAHSLWA